MLQSHDEDKHIAYVTFCKFACARTARSFIFSWNRNCLYKCYRIINAWLSELFFIAVLIWEYCLINFHFSWCCLIALNKEWMIHVCARTIHCNSIVNVWLARKHFRLLLIETNWSHNLIFHTQTTAFLSYQSQINI